MYATERHDEIRSRLESDGRVEVARLAHEFGVTAETIRRDLDELESASLLRRVHGGAIAATGISTDEPTLHARAASHSAEKQAIARRARSLLHDRSIGSLYLDGGTTTEAVATALMPTLATEKIEVVTHAVSIAHCIAADPDISLTVIGGRVRGRTAAAVGATTVHAIHQLRPDLAFLGTNGLSAALGLSTPDPDEAEVKRAILHSARSAVVVADATKFDQELLVSFAGLSDLDLLITDQAPPAELADALNQANVEVLLA